MCIRDSLRTGRKERHLPVRRRLRRSASRLHPDAGADQVLLPVRLHREAGDVYKRQTYERTLGETNDVEKARAAVYTRTCEIIRSFRIEGNQEKLFG